MSKLDKKINKYTFINFNKEEILELIENIIYLINNQLQNDPLSIMYANFDLNLYNHIESILYIQLENIKKKNADYFKEEIKNLINISYYLFYTNIIPKRSYTKTFIRIKPNLPTLKNKISYLQNLVQPEQRTDEWYKFRHNTLTASNIWKCFISQATQNQLIYEKCLPLNLNLFNKLNISINSPLHWGQKYEPISVLYYENLYKTKIGDFGCIKHSEVSYIAASPDGINILETSPLYGRMLEIKNIVNREINGIPKLEYWVQMQLQMETCNLNECDFLETKFIEYEDEEAFNLDGSFNLSADNCLKGKILYFAKDNHPYYEYMPLNLTLEESIEWEENIMNKNNHLTWIRTLYWKLIKVSCILVLRNKFWFTQALPYITNIWDIIQQEKDSNYEHRAPKKRQKKLQVIKSECCIDMSHIT